MGVGLIRTVILYAFTILAVRLMGKRQIGELEPTELVVTLLISDLATLSMQDPEAPLINSVVPILTLVILEVLMSSASLKFPRLRRLLSGKYSVLVDHGVVDQKEMKKSQMTVDELMEELRQNGVMAVEDAAYCVLENDGKVSVIPASDAPQSELPLILIADGVPVKKNLLRGGVTDARLKKVLASGGVARVRDVFLLYRIGKNYTCIPKVRS